MQKNTGYLFKSTLVGAALATGLLLAGIAHAGPSGTSGTGPVIGDKSASGNAGPGVSGTTLGSGRIILEEPAK